MVNDVGPGADPAQLAGDGGSSQPAAAEPAGQALLPGGGAAPGHPRRIPLTRASATWVAVFGAMVALVIVLVFILENLRSVKVTFFGAHWRVPLGVDLLLAAVLGGLLVVLVGTVRILQLRREARRRTSQPLR